MGKYVEKHALSKREAELIVNIAMGVTATKDLATELDISPSTVSNHLDSIFEKTGANDKASLLSQIILYIAADFLYPPLILLSNYT